MTGAQILFFYVLPAVILVDTWVAVLLYERSLRDRHHPGE